VSQAAETLVKHEVGYNKDLAYWRLAFLASKEMSELRRRFGLTEAQIIRNGTEH